VTGYLLRRILQIPFIVLAVIIVNFSLIHLVPGDPATVMTGEFGFVGGQPTDFVQQVREKWGLTKPLYEQLWIYVVGVVRGDMGYSFAFNRPVLQLILERLPATLLLLLTGQGLAIILGSALGTLAAARYSSRLDGALTRMAIMLHAIPVFWTGLMLILILGAWLRLLPTSGMRSASGVATDPIQLWVPDVLRHMILPTIALLLYLMPVFLRVTRASVLDIRNEEFLVTARAKGLRESDIFLRHALPNALLPTITVGGLLIGSALSGAVLTETVFSWPGVGRLLYEAIGLRDYPLIMGILVVASLGVVVMSLLTDVLYARFDPRVVYS
jgi:peptide/nickel transport system permease protein